uniref:RGS domain-containing protein n=1 Tax=Globodera rostochiensis TaxID=31243 RepID=A0A914I4Q7_GLORO
MQYPRHFDDDDDETSDLSTSDSELSCFVGDRAKECPRSHRHGRQHRRMNISPVLPRPADVRDDLDIPPLPRPLQLSKEWRPLQTSTLTNFHATLSKTNARQKLPPIVPLEPPQSLFHSQYTAMCCAISSTDEFNKPVRPEQFNLPSMMAKAEGIRGILFLQLCVTGNSVLKVQVRNGAYFLKSLPISSFVKVEIRRSISSRRRDKYYAAAHHQQQKRRFCSRVTYPVLHNNQPEFYEEFTFRISRTHLEHGDKLGISVFVQHSEKEKTPELLGGMSFSLVKMIKMAHVKLYEGGFFLLPGKKALTTNFARDNISIRKYYDDIGGSSTTMSTTTSSMESPSRKSGPSSPPSSCELIDQHQQQQSPKRTKAAPSADGRAGRLRTALGATDTVRRRVASFTFSPPGTLRRGGGSVQHNQHHFLTTDNKQHGIRLDKRNSVSTAGGAGGGGMGKLHRKTALGPLSKTLHFLRSKLDFSMSASVLCPSREDCRLWQQSFEALLAHKYGCLLFRAFLHTEFSEENLEFWLECEEFKRMKTGKKSTAQKANQIFNNFVRELAPKEVNLDSQTRLATQAALAVVPLRTEMFTMAQHKIVQLMAKDSYPRFLKSEQYLELLNNNFF